MCCLHHLHHHQHHLSPGRLARVVVVDSPRPLSLKPPPGIALPPDLDATAQHVSRSAYAAHASRKILNHNHTTSSRVGLDRFLTESGRLASHSSRLVLTCLSPCLASQGAPRSPKAPKDCARTLDSFCRLYLILSIPSLVPWLRLRLLSDSSIDSQTICAASTVRVRSVDQPVAPSTVLSGPQS